MSELNISSELLQVSAEVQQALKNNQPVVALESTIISHGMPFPENAQTALEVEETIRRRGGAGNHCDYSWRHESWLKP